MENNKHTGDTPPTESGEKRHNAIPLGNDRYFLAWDRNCKKCQVAHAHKPSGELTEEEIPFLATTPTEHTQAGEADYEAELDYALYNYKNALRHRFEGTNIGSYKGEEAETKSRIFVTVRTLIDRKSAEAYERGKRERDAELREKIGGMKCRCMCEANKRLDRVLALLTPPSATNNTEGV